MKIESKSRKIGGSRFVLIPASMADWFFGAEKDGEDNEIKVLIEDTTQFGGKKIIIEVG
jgi:hypothetical protein